MNFGNFSDLKTYVRFECEFHFGTIQCLVFSLYGLQHYGSYMYIQCVSVYF